MADLIFMLCLVLGPMFAFFFIGDVVLEFLYNHCRRYRLWTDAMADKMEA